MLLTQEARVQLRTIPRSCVVWWSASSTNWHVQVPAMRLPPRLGGVLLPAVGRYSCARLSLGRPPALRATAGAQQL